MKRFLVALGLMTLAACSSVPEQTTVTTSTAYSLADWETWKANENAAWSTKEFAILKIDDAIYLKDGESAWLTTRRQKALSHRWLLGQPRSGGHFVITYTGDKAKVFDRRTLKEYDLAETQTVKLGNGIDVRFARTQISPGVNGLRVMVYNQAHPAARDFKGLLHFPHEPNAVVQAKFELSPSAEGVDFQTSRGWVKRITRVGYAHFTLYGKPVKLGMFSDETDPKKVKKLSAFFHDELSGSETYGVGRYIDIDVNGVPETLTVDFNRAYNPNCARSPHYNCPVAIEKLPVALRAGEMNPQKH
jgi:uncharacterized protein (DUF1684 family)